MFSIIALTSLIYAADMQEPRIPSRFTCTIVRVLYKKYSKKYSQEDMENFLRSKNVTEDRIVSAKRCLAV